MQVAAQMHVATQRSCKRVVVVFKGYRTLLKTVCIITPMSVEGAQARQGLLLSQSNSRHRIGDG